jgi:hypothetical protein
VHVNMPGAYWQIRRVEHVLFIVILVNTLNTVKNAAKNLERVHPRLSTAHHAENRGGRKQTEKCKSGFVTPINIVTKNPDLVPQRTFVQGGKLDFFNPLLPLIFRVL